MRKVPSFWNDSWPIRMAIRDARHQLGRLALFAASLTTGIAALVSIGSLNDSLQRDIDRNAKELLGADVVANGNRAFEPEVIRFLDSIPAQQCASAEMASMVSFPKTQRSRLIRLNAVGNGFPFYGTIVTVPDGAWRQLSLGRQALLDESLGVQFGVKTGDSIRLGNVSFLVAGMVRKFPGGTGLLQTFTPSVYIGYPDLAGTCLVQYGSRVTWRRYYRIADEAEATRVAEHLRPRLKKFGYSVETVETRKESLGRAFGSVYQFFSLLAFVALVLGCIGVASSVHIYAREKRQEVAILRCLGASGWRAFRLYAFQILAVGIVASAVGVLVGAALQQLVPVVFKDFIPGDISLGFSVRSGIQGFLTGIVVSVLFSALPLLAVRFVPPLTVLRTQSEVKTPFSKARLFVFGLIVLFPAVAAAWLTSSITKGLMFTAGLLVALGLLWFTAGGLLWLVRRYFPHRAGFVWRHALAGLFRPMNQTRLMLVTIGLGTFIICTLNIIQSSLLGQVEFAGNSNQSNAILFDIQPDQKDGIAELIRSGGYHVNQLVPIVTCRLQSLRGKSVEDWRADSTAGIPEWALMREYRVTYRDTISRSEELTEGSIQRYMPGRKDSVTITLSEDFRDNLKVNVGDTLVFDVQGMPVRATIGGMRKVEWPTDPPNFIVVFPAGILEQAPQTWVAATRLSGGEPAARFQQNLVELFPNVSLIDLALVLDTVNAIFEKVGLVVRFLALFSMITGLIVLAGAVVNSRYARLRENVLLRTIGARARQLTWITLIEYVWLGLFSALTGMVLSLGGGFLLCEFLFEVTFRVDGVELVWLSLAIVVLTALIGWWNSRRVILAPPLQILRGEG